MTAFGILLRRERRDRRMLLGDLAGELGISTPYLSQIETGARLVPEGFEDKVITALGLSQSDANEFRRAAAVSRSQYAIGVDTDASSDDHGLAAELALSFARLSPAAKEKMRELIREDRCG